MHPEMERARARYRDVPTPDALAFTVASAIRKGERQRRRSKALRRVWGSGLAACACFVLLLNTSSTFAGAVAQVPVLGELARIFTVTEYTLEDERRLIDVRLPALEGTGHTDLEQQINTEIAQRIQFLIHQAETRTEEARDAYVATGGQEEAFIPVIIDVDYEITCQNQQYLSFVITETETQATAYSQFYPYTIDLETGREVSLRDLLGPNWKQVVNDSVQDQIAQRSQNPDQVYWDGSYVDAFETIRDDQPFYLNQAGHVVILFEKYEIAPGYMGAQTFEILPPV